MHYSKEISYNGNINIICLIHKINNYKQKFISQKKKYNNLIKNKLIKDKLKVKKIPKIGNNLINCKFKVSEIN